jgi:hypothetical protein
MKGHTCSRHFLPCRNFDRQILLQIDVKHQWNLSPRIVLRCDICALQRSKRPLDSENNIFSHQTEYEVPEGNWSNRT